MRPARALWVPVGMVLVDSRDLIRMLEADGWIWHSTTGSHRHFKHPVKPGKITIPHPKKDMHPKTVRSILRAAGL